MWGPAWDGPQEAVWWQAALPCDDVPEAAGKDAEEVGGEVVVCLRREAVVAWGFVLPETVDGLPGLRGW